MSPTHLLKPYTTTTSIISVIVLRIFLIFKFNFLFTRVSIDGFFRRGVIIDHIIFTVDFIHDFLRIFTAIKNCVSCSNYVIVTIDFIGGVLTVLAIVNISYRNLKTFILKSSKNLILILLIGFVEALCRKTILFFVIAHLWFNFCKFFMYNGKHLDLFFLPWIRFVIEIVFILF